MKVYFLFVIFMPYQTLATTLMHFKYSKDHHALGVSTGWYHIMKSAFIFNKAGVSKKAQVQLPLFPTKKWTSKYASLTFNFVSKEFPAGGINEKGLVIEAALSVEGKSPAIRPRNYFSKRLDLLQWTQFYLDTAENLKQVVTSLVDQNEVIPFSLESPVHYLVCDKNANCGAFEYFKKKLIITLKDKRIEKNLARPKKPAVVSYKKDDLLERPVLANHSYQRSKSIYHNCLNKKCDHIDESFKRFNNAFKGNALKNQFSGQLNWSEHVLLSVRQPLPYTQWNILFIYNKGQISVKYRNPFGENPQWYAISMNFSQRKCQKSASQIWPVDFEKAASDITDTAKTFNQNFQNMLVSNFEDKLHRLVLALLISYPEKKTSCI